MSENESLAFLVIACLCMMGVFLFFDKVKLAAVSFLVALYFCGVIAGLL